MFTLKLSKHFRAADLDDHGSGLM